MVLFFRLMDALLHFLHLLSFIVVMWACCVCRMCSFFFHVLTCIIVGRSHHYNVVYATKWSYFRNKFKVFVILFHEIEFLSTIIMNIRYHISLYWTQLIRCIQRLKCSFVNVNSVLRRDNSIEPLCTWTKLFSSFRSRAVQQTNFHVRQCIFVHVSGGRDELVPSICNEVLNFPVFFCRQLFESNNL